MSVTESLKRKCEELELKDVDEKSTVLETEVIKVETTITEHNLENSSPINLTVNECETQTKEQLTVLETELIKVETTITEHSLENSSPINLTVNECETQTTTESVAEESKESDISISIKFHDDTTADLYKSKFLKFINSFTELQVKHEDSLTIDVYRDEHAVVDENSVIQDDVKPGSAKKRKKHHSKVKKELFIVDATPSPTTVQTRPRYTTKFIINTDKEFQGNDTQQIKQPSCFNCEEFHSLRDCPYPKDYTKINMARQSFKSQPKSSRYHLEEDQKFGDLKPGKMSDELRKALGLHKNEAPRHIYLMRKLGYPPGWLEEAKLTCSDLQMFDIDGNFLKMTTAKKQGLDACKIVDYPGFNVPFQKGVKDDHQMYRVPPYSDSFSKDAMISFFDKQFVQEDNLETCDMDIEHEPESTNLNPEPANLIQAAKSNDRNSPSLVDLEQQKQQLLEELNDEPKAEVKNANIDPEKETSVIKASCFGTPVLKSNSPYLTLPNPDNFSRDVSPVINFENLPNTTGKYEQLTDVLQKVRNTLKNNKCNS
jgi:zinc finger CCHC domain-containing protein 8